MTGEQRDRIVAYLRALPEVAWDRLVRDDARVVVYGWVGRRDGRRDFVLLTFEADGAVGLTTSSATYSADFAARLFGGHAGHAECERVADVLGLHDRPAAA